MDEWAEACNDSMRAFNEFHTAFQDLEQSLFDALPFARVARLLDGWLQWLVSKVRALLESD